MKQFCKALSALVLMSAVFAYAESTGRGIDVVPGKIVRTYGFADMQNGGKGIAYPDTKNIIVIDDKTYPNPVKKREAFTNAIASGMVSGKNANKPSENPAIIVVSGTVDLSDGRVSDSDHSYWDAYDPKTHKKIHKDITYEIGANKAIIGVGKARIAFGGLTINGHAGNKNLAKNIIIQNIEFWDSHGSTEFDPKAEGTFTKGGKEYPYADENNKAGSNNLGIGYGDTYNGKANIPEYIWIDHCSFSDGTCEDRKRNFAHDGAVDIPFGRYITISYCDFANHDKVSLVGSRDILENPDERIVTFHHIYYHGVVQRSPLLRASKTHIYNNFYDDIGVQGNSGYGIGFARGGVRTAIENNYFGTFKYKIIQNADRTGEKDSVFFAKIYAQGNSKELDDSIVVIPKANKTGLPLSQHLVENPPFAIPYEYALEDAEGLNASLPGRVGSKVVTEVRVKGKAYKN